MKHLNFLIIITLIFTSCTSNYYVRGKSEKVTHFPRGFLITKAGEVHQFRKADIESDSTSWTDWDYNYAKMANKDLEKVVINRKATSASKGAMLGLGTGMVFGFSLYHTRGDKNSKDSKFLYGLLIPLLTITGGLLGLVRGVTKGKNKVYHFEEKQETIDNDEKNNSNK